MTNNNKNKNKILVVDDVAINRLVLRELFDGLFEILEAENGKKALEILDMEQENIKIVLLDIIMPVMNGMEVLQQMNHNDMIKKIPVIIISGTDDDESTLRAYELGASDMIRKPFNAEIIYRRVENVMDLYTYKNNLEQRVAEQKAILAEQEKKIKATNLFLIDALSTTVEFRSSESGEHVKRVRVLTKFFLGYLKEDYHLSDDQIEAISNASALHDIGKIGISDNILLKPGKLTNEEFEIMKTHSMIGCQILDSLGYFDDLEFYKYCYEICRFHHERYDGRGYPDKLVGEEIPIWAQIVSLVDVYDALTSPRVYKKSFTHDEAIHMILNNECGTFNPVLLETMYKHEKEIAAFDTKKIEKII